MKGHIRKRGNKWAFVLDIGIDEETGKRKQKWFSGYRTKPEAERAMIATINEINSGTFKEPSKEKVSIYLRTWLKGRQDKLKPTTYTMYKRVIERYIIPSIGRLRLDQLNDIHLDRMYKKLNKRYSKSTVLGVHRVLKIALTRATTSGFIKVNPADIVEPPSKTKRSFTVWDEVEAAHFLQMAKDSRYYIAFLLALYTGMRRGEILGLRWKDIDFERKTLSVLQTLSNDGKVFQDAKTGSSERSIALQNHVIRELQKHRQKVREERMKAGSDYENSDLVVCTRYGTKVLPQNLYREWKKLKKKSGLPDIRFHDLRHTHATLLLKQGVHPKIVSERLGHSSINITLDTYSHVLPGLQEAAAASFEEMMSEAKNTLVE